MSLIFVSIFQNALKISGRVGMLLGHSTLYWSTRLLPALKVQLFYYFLAHCTGLVLQGCQVRGVE